jgi:hypothetical protein
MVASFRSASTGEAFEVSTTNVTKPAGTATGDVMLACVSATGGTAAQVGTPTGGATWSLLDSLDAGVDGLHTKIFWKVAGASEPANYAFPLNASIFFAYIAILALSGAAGTEPLHASGTAGTGAIVTTPTLTPSAADDLEVRFAAASGEDGWTAPATYTLRADLGGLAVATKALSSASATGTQNFTASFDVGSRHGFTIDVATLIPNAGRSPVIRSSAAVHRAANF